MIKDFLIKIKTVLTETFGHLFDFSYQRKKHEVLGFYFGYTFFIILVGSLLNGIITIFTHPYISAYEEGLIAGQEVSMVFIPVFSLIVMTFLSVTIIVSKKIHKNIAAIITAVLSIIITPLLGAIVGCVPLTILTTFQNKKYIKTEE